MSPINGLRRTGKAAPKTVNVRVKFLTAPQVEQLVKAAREHSRYGERDAAMILLAYHHGLRVSELCALRWDDIDLKAGTLSVRRVKGGAPSLHPLPGTDRRALRRLKGSESPWVFNTERGSAMTPAGVRDLLRRLGLAAGLGRVHPHMLRHACGYKLTNQGTELRLVQAYLGHRSIASTVRYTEVDERRFRGLF
jgi:type 1 fimbriae regulatory protein FimB/type 1 fimbriae regulatory protein FimE